MFVRFAFGRPFAIIRRHNMKLSPDHSLAGILEPVFAIRTETRPRHRRYRLRAPDD